MILHANLVEAAIAHAQYKADNTVYSFMPDGENIENQITFHQLDQSARRLAAHLQSYGKKGDRVVLLFNPGLGFIEAFFACLYAGMVAVPVNPPGGGQTWGTFISIVNDAGAIRILTDAAKAKFLERFSALGEFPLELSYSCIDDAKLTPIASYAKPNILPEDIAMLQYTSGTTSTPKGVIITHHNLIHNQEAIHHAIMGNARIGVSWLPLYHDMGLIGSVLQALYLGGHCMLMSPSSFFLKPVRWLQVISKFKAEVSGAPNFAYDLCINRIDEEQLKGIDLSSWSVAASGAEAVQALTLERFADKFSAYGFNRSSFVPCYGMAESTLLVNARKLTTNSKFTIKEVSRQGLVHHKVSPSQSGEDLKKLVSCGVANDDSILVVDPLNSQPVDNGNVGELVIRSESVAQGYWNNPTQTAELFNRTISGKNGYFYTGDLGFIQDGEIFITGRLKDLIIIRGKNFYPKDIELVAQGACESLIKNSGAAFSIETDNYEQLVLVHEVYRENYKAVNIIELEQEIRIALASQLSVELTKLVLVKQGSIPITSSGKVKRLTVRNQFLTDALSTIE